MAVQTSAAGSVCTSSMIGANCKALNNVCNMMDIIEFPDLQSIFQVIDIEVFLDVKTAIYGNASFDEVMMDYALRRRFSFYEVEPAFAKASFRSYLEAHISTREIVDKVIYTFLCPFALERFPALCFGSGLSCAMEIE